MLIYILISKLKNYLFVLLKLFYLIKTTGKSNCPYYARAELVADNLAKNLPDFKVYKILKNPNEWNVSLSQ